MSTPSIRRSFRRHSVPLVLFGLVTLAVLVVPPLVLGEVTTRTYAIAAAILILAVGAAFPYAVLVALGTLPLLRAGIASFAAPQRTADGPHSFSAEASVRHVVAGVAYVLGAAAVGAIGLGAQIGLRSGPTATPTFLRPSFLYLGGLLVGGAFVALQLWRYDAPPGDLDRRTALATVGLGVLIALAPAVAFWVFDGGV
ncbi:hypothetical protein [Haloparvum sedimenti]|uniref:hypothetical protein n=1 Tax=Haloparvum sedimenti TaxID=1678448 RepID=UPI00071E9C49|nr:hypothetical protein [Haloparvum sedimenti]